MILSPLPLPLATQHTTHNTKTKHHEERDLEIHHSDDTRRFDGIGHLVRRDLVHWIIHTQGTEKTEIFIAIFVIKSERLEVTAPASTFD